ncbi:MAG: PCYCGC motif-containing (lipo)protein [Candidatus Cohnella colombiensis]|uniref:PCYCGC motif-containing (Lipo)protein n=1 Tax=Candidatus Cohnella colombiensis TaxID=3121368 RepID=A0AA95EYW5_9BACL|nr:MAG: PCYCGC motif-containing (lipo)protein [Cohnella sp.]
MKSRWLLALPSAVLACGVILAACGGNGSSASHDHSESHEGETWEHRASYADLPDFTQDFTDRVQHLYSIVGEYEEIMKQVKCYCGCMDYNNAHDSLHRCYVASKSADEVVWTDHSGLCGICTAELSSIETWTKEGKTPEQIVQLIEDNFNPNI